MHPADKNRVRGPKINCEGSFKLLEFLLPVPKSANNGNEGLQVGRNCMYKLKSKFHF